MSNALREPAVRATSAGGIPSLRLTPLRAHSGSDGCSVCSGARGNNLSVGSPRTPLLLFVSP
jgi:hypothetical protein